MISSEYEKASLKAEPAKRRPAPHLREAHFDDYHQIADLESRFDLAVKPYEEWLHLWQGNPLYEEVKEHWPIGWVLEEADGKIVGSMGNIPLLYELNGRRILAASGRHWVAEEDYRTASILLLDRLITQPDIDLYVNTTVSAASVPAVTALGCSPMQVGIWDEVAYWITNYLGCFASILAGKKPFAVSFWQGSWRHLKSIGPLLSRLSRYQASNTSLDNRAHNFHVHVTTSAGFDDRFDDFWEELRRTNPRQLLAVRSRKYLSWHFNYAIRANRLWIAAVADGAKLVAYAIFYKSANARAGINQVKLVDYRALYDSPPMLPAFVSWALDRCRSEGIHIFEHTGRWLEKGEFFETVAPYRRKLSSWQYFYRMNNPALRAVSSEKTLWAPSLFDGDATL